MKKLFSCLSVFIICSLPMINIHATSPSQQQQQVELNCLEALIADPLLLDQFFDGCPSSLPGNRITAIELSRKQLDTITGVLSDNVNTHFMNGLFNRNRDYALNKREGNPRSLGMNAGDPFSTLSFWGNFSYDILDNEFINTPYDSNTKTFMAGADILPMDNMVLGLALGYEDTSTDTDFNTGEQDIDGYTFAGYFGYLLNDFFSIDMAGGYSSIDIEQRRLSDSFLEFTPPALTPNAFFGTPTGTTITGEVDADRLFFAVNINGYWHVNNFIIDGHAGYLWAEEDQDRFIETTGTLTDDFGDREYELGQVRIGANVAYDFRSFLEPYFGVEYLNETTREELRLLPGMAQPANDDDEVLFTLGMRYFSNYGITGDLKLNITSGREDINAYSLMLLLRAEL